MQTPLYSAPKHLQSVVADIHFPQMIHGALKIVRIFTGLPLTIRDQVHLSIKRLFARILLVATVNNETKCLDLRHWSIDKRERAGHIQIDTRHLFALLQIGSGCVRIFCSDMIGKPATGPTAIKSEHQARLLPRPAMHMAENAKRPVISMKARGIALNKRKSRPPHQGPISKYPQILHDVATLA
jgi:hypothetical protein